MTLALPNSRAVTGLLRPALPRPNSFALRPLTPLPMRALRYVFLMLMLLTMLTLWPHPP